MSVMLPSVVTTTPMVECSAMTLRVPSSAASAMGYDAYFTALEAIKTAGSVEPAAIHAALWNTTYSGATGDIAFDGENGDAIRSEACIKQVDNASGAWRFVAMQKAE